MSEKALEPEERDTGSVGRQARRFNSENTKTENRLSYWQSEFDSEIIDDTKAITRNTDGQVAAPPPDCHCQDRSPTPAGVSSKHNSLY